MHFPLLAISKRYNAAGAGGESIEEALKRKGLTQQ